MIIRRCNQCKVETNEYTLQEDYSIWCKQCYDEGCSLLFKGDFTELEVTNRKKFLKMYYEDQKDKLRKIFKIMKVLEPSRNNETFINNCNNAMNKVIALETNRCIPLKITRSELLKYPDRFMEQSFTDKELIAIFLGNDEKIFNAIQSGCRLDWVNNNIDYNSLYRYYNPNII